MSEDADRAVAALDHAAGQAARAGRALAALAGEADGIARAFAAEWTGVAGRRAVSTAEGLHDDLHAAASRFLSVCDVLRVDGTALARALAWDAPDDELAAADPRLADALRQITGSTDRGAPWVRGFVGPVQVTPVPAPPSDPRSVPAWWRSLSPDDRERITREHPGLGGLDGLPAATRDALNRERLDGVLDAGTAPAAHRALGAHLEEDPRRMLLDVDPDGRAVVSDGDPDTASRVVTFVPGTGSGADDIADTARRATAVCTAAEAADPDTDDSGCVAVSWLDYPAPSDVPHAAVQRDPADEGAPRLRAFLEGADAAGDALGRTGTDRDVLGYSYGSVVVGTAASDRAGLAAGTQLHVASPGAGVDSLAGQFTSVEGAARPATPDEVIGVRSRWDPVPWWTMTGVHGAAPDDPGFGGRAVDVTEPGTPTLDAVAHVHSRYFDEGTVSLAEIGRLLAERP